MNSFWSVAVTLITIGSIAAFTFLLYWCSKDKMGKEEGESMGHSFDGIEELNNGLPKWWTYMFYMTIVFALGYLVLYPGLGNYEGVLGWKSANKNVQSIAESKAAAAAEVGIVQYDVEVRAADAKYAPIFEAFADIPVEELAYNEDAVKIGRRLFLQNCSQCHGSDAGGTTGFPNLTDDKWLWGGTPEDIKHTLLEGRVAAMPAWEETLGDDGVKAVIEYVLSLSGRRGLDVKLVEQGKQKFVLCAACHGPDGTGNKVFGAPDLTDQTWLYGGSRRAIEDTIRNGRAGVMPAWKERLGEDKVHVLTSYIYRLSHPNQ
ncbi:cytochrome-c oxidase, cbb3-type subunit III [Echinimonas agarilytica]|uniref:Cbb3-type cytochrome c oxidase subunit n=1 Tax=Echinimonas agarilytica TaxID=1215918 RepID=A0AA42B940_9GAMM|nr:cytochrome-c oxidase, cbb3-type subunit III [Echinimonas agarilytica]MCM2681188.1 cytochrome-c oxidase, cbb3-type subunit III [Echinimonas agarilytica]